MKYASAFATSDEFGFSSVRKMRSFDVPFDGMHSRPGGFCGGGVGGGFAGSTLVPHFSTAMSLSEVAICFIRRRRFSRYAWRSSMNFCRSSKRDTRCACAPRPAAIVEIMRFGAKPRVRCEEPASGGGGQRKLHQRSWVEITRAAR